MVLELLNGRAKQPAVSKQEGLSALVHAQVVQETLWTVAVGGRETIFGPQNWSEIFTAVIPVLLDLMLLASDLDFTSCSFRCIACVLAAFCFVNGKRS